MCAFCILKKENAFSYFECSHMNIKHENLEKVNQFMGESLKASQFPAAPLGDSQITWQEQPSIKPVL